MTAGAAAGWYRQQDGSSRYWDGQRWIEQPPTGGPWSPNEDLGPSGHRQSTIGVNQIAHDLAMVYITNRYGVEVTGEFEVDCTTSDGVVTDVDGSGSVETEKMPHVNQRRQVRVGTGEKHFFGIGPEKTRLVDTDEFEVDDTFLSMARDYRAAYARFLSLIGAS